MLLSVTLRNYFYWRLFTKNCFDLKANFHFNLSPSDLVPWEMLFWAATVDGRQSDNVPSDWL